MVLFFLFIIIIFFWGGGGGSGAAKSLLKTNKSQPTKHDMYVYIGCCLMYIARVLACQQLDFTMPKRWLTSIAYIVLSACALNSKQCSLYLYLDRPHINKTASSNAFVKSWIGRVTTIKCAVDANPLANFTWFKDGRAILNGVYSTHDVSTLTLTPKTADDFGLYSCNATNNKGTMWYRITMEQLCKYMDTVR